MPTSTHTAGSRASKWVARILITVGCAVGFGLMTWFSIVTFGHVQGVEFSPDTFGSREFEYYELPLVRMRVSPVYRERASGSLQSILSGSDRLKSATSAPREDPPRWDLVWMKRGTAEFTDDALIVYRYFDEETSNASERWRTWTTDHEKLADILWPAVAEACRSGLYQFTPALLATAEQMTVPKGTMPSEEQFQAAIAGVMAEQYTALADTRRAQGKQDEAKEYDKAALKHQSKSAVPEI